MKKKAFVLLACVTLLGCMLTACGKEKEVAENSEDLLKFEKGAFPISCEVSDVVEAGWESTMGEGGSIGEGVGMGFNIMLDDNTVNLQILNDSDGELEIAKCKVIGAQWTTEENKIPCEIRGLRVAEDTTKEMIAEQWGEPSEVSEESAFRFFSNDEEEIDQEYLMYENESGFCEFAFSKDGKLQNVFLEKRDPQEE